MWMWVYFTKVHELVLSKVNVCLFFYFLFSLRSFLQIQNLKFPFTWWNLKFYFTSFLLIFCGFYYKFILNFLQFNIIISFIFPPQFSFIPFLVLNSFFALFHLRYVLCFKFLIPSNLSLRRATIYPSLPWIFYPLYLWDFPSTLMKEATLSSEMWVHNLRFVVPCIFNFSKHPTICKNQSENVIALSYRHRSTCFGH
jgi:hypothetical protein